MTFQAHGVVSIELGDIKTSALDNGLTFSTRVLKIKTKDYEGAISEYATTMFADNGYDLLVEDKILEDMKIPFELKAA